MPTSINLIPASAAAAAGTDAADVYMPAMK